MEPQRFEVECVARVHLVMGEDATRRTTVVERGELASTTGGWEWGGLAGRSGTDSEGTSESWYGRVEDEHGDCGDQRGTEGAMDL